MRGRQLGKVGATSLQMRLMTLQQVLIVLYLRHDRIQQVAIQRV